MRRLFAFLVLLGGATTLRAEPPALLDEALEHWLGERDQWAFTQQVREFDNGKLREERLERYDPSRPDHRRWELLSVNGAPPNAERLAAWHERKNRKRKPRHHHPVGAYFDFDHARVVGETRESVRYEVPLRKEVMSWLIPVEKVAVTVTVDKATRALEHVSAGLREPFKIAFGLARIADAALSVRFGPDGSSPTTAEKSGAPKGRGHVVLFKFGNRAEFAWSDFQRVTAYASRYAGTGAPTTDADL